MKSGKYHHDYHKEQAIYKKLDTDLIKRLLKYLYPYRAKLSLAILLLLISKAIEAIVPIYIGLISQKILNTIGDPNADRSLIMNYVFWSCLAVIGILILGYIFDSINVFFKSQIGQKAVLAMRSDVYQHIERLPLKFFDKNAVGKLMTRTIHDIEQIDEMFTDSVVPLIGSIFLFICISIGIILISWKIGLAIALIMPFVWWLTNNFRINQRRSYELVRSIISSLNGFVQEHLLGAATVRNFGLQNKEKVRFDEINEDLFNGYLESIHNFAFFIAGIDFITNVTLISVFAILVYSAPIDTGFQAGTYFTFSLYALMVFRPLVDLAERYNVLQSAMAASERIFHILDTPLESDTSQNELGPIETISFEDVWFAYNDENWVLKGINLEIKRGDSLAVVGMTGAGKSTLMNLILRLYDYQKGSIKINDQDIRTYSLQSLRKQFCVVLQDPVIFTGSIADNIALYDPTITKDKMDHVVNYINMRSIVDRQPEGLDFILAERGKSLSVGEMQLIAMARAVAHERSMLILDEATANIDSHTEKIIQDALKKIISAKTSLIIAHRLSTIKDVSRIIVLHKGQIIESGTHQELLAAKGIYEKLYRLQFQSL